MFLSRVYSLYNIRVKKLVIYLMYFHSRNGSASYQGNLILCGSIASFLPRHTRENVTVNVPLND